MKTAVPVPIARSTVEIPEGRAAQYARFALAIVAICYAFLRFGLRDGTLIAVAVTIIVLLDLWQRAEAIRTNIFIRGPIISIQIAIVFCLFFAPAPFGFGSDVPGPIMLESPLFVLLLCLLASYISAARPLITAWTGISIFAMWAVARVWVLRDPLTIVSANIDVSKYKTMIALYHVVNQPHFFNASLWRADFYVAITATAVLTLAAYRVHRLAVRSGRQARLRDALATHFSPQIVELLAKSREIGLTRWSKDLAVLDCDLVGFTTLAEGLPPERVAEILQAYRAVVESAVFGTGGAIVSYTGDGVTAAFGLTDGGAPGATCAVACAQDIARNWPDAGRDALGSDAPGLAIGIDFGPASAGLVGEERALSLLLLGTPVDGAAELQAMTREVSAQILLSDAEKLAATASDPALATKLHPIEILGTTTWSLSDE